jgi:phage pi2 protein 07
VIILLFLIWIFFKIPSVQNWLAQQATDYLSSELNTKVLVDKVEIQLFKRAVFKNFYVEDLNRDTLIHASDLTAHFDISKILKGKLVIKGIDLDNGYFQYNRLEGQKNFNLQFLISYFQPKKKPTKKGKFELDIRKINLTDSKFCMKDEIAGSKIYVFAPKAYLHAKNTNIIANFAACDSVYFEDAIVKINVFRGCPLVKNPEDSLKNKFIQPNWKVSAGLCRFVNLDFHLENEIIGKKPELPIDFADLHLQI